MRKTSESLWEFAMAMIALAGGLTLIQPQLELRAIIIGSLFGVGFIIMLTTFIWRLWDAFHPVRITRVDLNINTLEARRALDEGRLAEPIATLEIDFVAFDDVRINREVKLKLEKDLASQLKGIGRFPQWLNLETGDPERWIELKSGEGKTGKTEFLLQLRKPFSNAIDAKVEDLTGRFSIGWHTLGNRIAWHKAEIT